MQKGQQNQEKLDQKLIWYFGCLRDPQTHPGAKKTPQMACESQIWPRCTPRGITSLFRTKELIFKTDRSKLSHFTRNYPVVGNTQPCWSDSGVVWSSRQEERWERQLWCSRCSWQSTGCSFLLSFLLFFCLLQSSQIGYSYILTY